MNKSYKIVNTFFISVMLLVFMLVPCSVDTMAANSVTSTNQIELATKIPISKRTIAMKFLLAMLGVAVSSVVIFVLLSLYNKYFYGGPAEPITEENVDNDFKTPVNMKEALSIFLKKTK